MIHTFECDNCGQPVETGCFDTSDRIVIYHTPVIQERPIRNQLEFAAYMTELATTAMTAVCKECKEQ